MSRLARAIEILEVLNEYFQEGTAVYPGALILEDDMTIAEAIADCLGQEDK
jgi:hypothetical protein